ncbi:MAG: type IX secretion system sortase PorU, partial [Bacteroidota bacterium]
METAYGKLEVPSFDNNHFSYSSDKGITYFTQFDNEGSVDENSVSVNNISYEAMSASEAKDIVAGSIPTTPKYSIYNTNARGKRALFFEITPLVNDRGTIKRITSFTVNYNASAGRGFGSLTGRPPIANSVMSSGDWYRFYVEETGVHQLTRNFLNQLGINTNSVDPRTIKIYGTGGQMLPLLNFEDYPTEPIEHAVKFVGEEDGNLDSNDYILFYAQGPNGKHQLDYNQTYNSNINLFTERTYYYVNVSPGNGKRIPTLNQPDAPADIQVTTFQDHQFYEVDEFNLVKIGRRWFGDEFDIENQRSYSFTFPNLVASEPASVEVAVGSISETPSTMDISVNGSSIINLPLPQVDLGGSVLASIATNNSPVTLGGDEVTFNLTYDNAGNPSSNAFLDYINIEATRNLIFDGGQMRFYNNGVSNAAGVAEYQLSNATNVVEVWDVTDIFNIGGYQNTDQQSTFAFKTIAGQARQYVALSNSGYLEPSRNSNSRVVNQNLKGTILENSQGDFEDVDYLIIARNNFLSQAERLAQINRDQYNLKVKVVSLDLIYNEFSTGNQDISALRNFVRYVYQNASTEDNRLKYLCLFGDASYDYKERLNNNTNIMPAWYSENSISLTNSFVSDDFFTMMDNDEGALGNGDRMDIAVGRMLVEDVQRAKEMVDKVEAYYQREAYGSWRNNLLLISDDVDESWERILQETTDGIGTDVTQEKPFINVYKIHTDAFQQQSSAAGDRYPQVTEAMKDAIEVGALVVNYFGHGGEDGLAKERIFDKIDAQTISNICKFNCFVTVTCEYTKFDDPNRDTAGEFTFWNTDGGAISLITTTRQIFVTVGVSYNEVLEDYLFAFGSNDYPTMAEALRLTKIDNNIAGIGQKRLVFFIGDPAMKLAFPRPNVRLTQINDVPIGQETDTLKALSYTKLSGEVVDEGGNLLSNYNGIVTTTVFDKPISRSTLGNDGITDGGQLIILDYETLGEVIFKGQATVENGQFEVDFIVPRDIGIPVGPGRVSFYSQTLNPLSDQAGASFDIQVGGINENAEEDNIGPVINLFMNDENFVSGGITNESPTLLAKLQDDNGINTASGIGHDIIAILDGDETNPFVLNDYYQANVDDYQNGTVTFAFRDLEPGLHTLSLRAWDVYNNSSTAEIQFNVFDQ